MGFLLKVSPFLSIEVRSWCRSFLLIGRLLLFCSLCISYAENSAMTSFSIAFMSTPGCLASSAKRSFCPGIRFRPVADRHSARVAILRVHSQRDPARTCGLFYRSHRHIHPFFLPSPSRGVRRRPSDALIRGRSRILLPQARVPDRSGDSLFWRSPPQDPDPGRASKHEKLFSGKVRLTGQVNTKLPQARFITNGWNMGHVNLTIA